MAFAIALATAAVTWAPIAQAGFLDDLNKIGGELRKLGEDVRKVIGNEPSTEPSPPPDTPEKTAPSPQKTVPSQPTVPSSQKTSPAHTTVPSSRTTAPSSQPAQSTHLNEDRARVTKAQKLLNSLGYDVGTADGIYGNKTRTRIRQFEADRGLPPRGDVTDRVLRHLTSAAQAMEKQRMTADRSGASGPGMAAGKPRSAEPVTSSGVRTPAPVLMGDRLLSGYPLSYSKQYVQDVYVGRGKRPVNRSTFNLGLYFDLAVLRAWPQILDTSKKVFDGQRTADDHLLAQTYAERFLTGELLFRYLGECGGYGCTSTGSDAFGGWAGNDEFKREASYRAFLAEVVPKLLAMAPSLPIRVLHVVEVQLQSYDSAAGGFPLRDLRKIAASPFANARFASKLNVESSYRIPSLVRVAQSSGSSFLQPLKNRNAYLAVDVSVGEPHWDYKLDRPVLKTQWSNPRLYADPEMKQLIHHFADAGGSEKLAQSAAVDAQENALPPDSSTPTAESADKTTRTSIPHGLIVYKFHPSVLSDERLLQAARQQVGMDQAWYKNPSRGSGALFSKEQVVGRVSDFAARELLPEYKQRVASFAERVPRRATVQRKLKLDFLVFEDGTLHSKPGSQGGQGKEVLFRQSLLSESDKLALPPLGSREIPLGNVPQLFGAMDTSDIPNTISSLRASRVGHLALDRYPTIPPIRLAPAVAEQLWRRPRCEVSDFRYRRQGMPPKQAEEAANRCRAEHTAYSDSLTVAYELDIEEVVLTQRAWIVKAKLLGADVYGTRNELLAHFDAESFVPATDSWAKKQEALAAKQKAREAAEAKKLAAARAAEDVVSKRLDALRQSLSQTDIIGIRLGMSVGEAERIIRQHMKVGWVTTLDRAEHERVLSQMRIDRVPYNEFRAFVGTDGTEQIVIYTSPAAPDRVQAVTRVVPVPANISNEVIAAKLNEKYGEPVATHHYTVWTADFGKINVAPKPDSLAAAYRAGSCVVQLNTWAYVRKVDGTELTSEDRRAIRSRTPAISVWGGKLQPNGDVWDSDEWRECGPVVISQVVGGDGSDPKFLSVGMADLSTYSDLYKRRIKELEAEAGAQALPKL